MVLYFNDQSEDYYSAVVVAQKGTQADTLSAADFDNFTGSEYGHVTVSQKNTTYSITLNATGISDVQTAADNSAVAKICLREYTHDYLNSAPTTGVNVSGISFADNSSNKPYIIVTSH